MGLYDLMANVIWGLVSTRIRAFFFLLGFRGYKYARSCAPRPVIPDAAFPPQLLLGQRSLFSYCSGLNGSM